MTVSFKERQIRIEQDFYQTALSAIFKVSNFPVSRGNITLLFQTSISLLWIQKLQLLLFM